MTPPRPRRFWHYTCLHGIDGIIATGGMLRPNPRPGPQPWADRMARRIIGPTLRPLPAIRALPVVWLTDVDVKTRDDAERIGLGMPGTMATCDRVAYRFRVPPTSGIAWWPDWADGHVDDVEFRGLLEHCCLPERWWVFPGLLPGCRLDERYNPPEDR